MEYTGVSNISEIAEMHLLPLSIMPRSIAGGCYDAGI